MLIPTGARSIGAAARNRPLDFGVRPTKPQRLFLEEQAPVALLRGGNQIGKTSAIIWDLIWRCRGEHPYQRLQHRPPINAILLSESWDQMGQSGGFLEKLWAALPKSEIDPRTRFDPGRGITGKPPRIVFTSGPGKGSVITLATYKQGAQRVAGSTVHYVGMDEPGPASLFHEVVPRLMRHQGVLRINFTPVLNMPPQTELRQMVDNRQVIEHNPWLKEESCWPEGAPFPWLSQRQIDSTAALWPEAIRRMRVEGWWDPVIDGRWLSNFDEAAHIRIDEPPPGAYLGVGVDHGAQAGKQAAVLFAAVDRDGLKPYVWYLDESLSDGASDPQQDAAAILTMLRRNGLSWSDVDLWMGDRGLQAAGQLTYKSNTILRRHLASLAGIPSFPNFQTPRKFHGSVEHGLWLWNALLGYRDGDGTPHVFIHPRCERIIEFCAKFAGDRRDPLKDVGDAARYILEASIREQPPLQLVQRY